MGKATDFDDEETLVFETLPAGMRNREPEREETEAERKTREFFDDMNGKDAQEVGYIDIYRVAGASSFGAKDFCVREPSDRFPDPESLMMYLRENFGAGHYRIQGRIEGKKGVRLNTLLTIAKKSGDENPRNLPAVFDPDKHGDNLSSVMAMIAQQNQQAQQNMMMMLESMRPQKSTIFDMPIFRDKELLALLLPVAVTAITAALKSRRDPMEQITQLLTITGTIKDMRDDGDGAANADTWPALAGKFVDQLGVMLPALSAGKGAPAPAALPNQAAPAGPSPIAQAFAGHLEQLVKLADAGAEPGAAAAMVLQSVPPHLLPKLLEFLDGDDCITQLGRVNPGVFDRAIWFDELRYAVLDAPESGADTGDTAPDADGPDNAITGTTDPTQ